MKQSNASDRTNRTLRSYGTLTEWLRTRPRERPAEAGTRQLPALIELALRSDLASGQLSPDSANELLDGDKACSP